MKRAAVVVGLSLLLMGATWPVQKVRDGLVLLSTSKGNCTAFAISPSYLATAAHCLMDDTPHVVLRPMLDDGVGVVLSVNHGRKPLKLGKPPQAGDAVLVAGFALSQEDPFLLAGMFIHPSTHLPTMPPSFGNRSIFQVPLVAGMSGAPVVDGAGAVVSVALCSAGLGDAYWMVSCGVPYEEVASVFRRYGAR